MFIAKKLQNSKVKNIQACHGFILKQLYTYKKEKLILLF